MIFLFRIRFGFYSNKNEEKENNKIDRSFNKFPGILSDSFWSSEVNQLSIRSVSSIKYFIKMILLIEIIISFIFDSVQNSNLKRLK